MGTLPMQSGALWEADIARLLSTPPFRQEWPNVRRSFANQGHFSERVIDLHRPDAAETENEIELRGDVTCLCGCHLARHC